VGIARALITSPKLVVLDEPTSTLDPTVREEILDLLRSLQSSMAVAYLFISHDIMAVERLSHRVAVMYLATSWSKLDGGDNGRPAPPIHARPDVGGLVA